MTERILSLTITESLGISLIGFSIVFVVLVILMAVIRLLRFTMDALGAGTAATAAPVQTAVPAPAMNPARGSLGELKLNNVDEKTAAMLMAIVANELQAPLNELRFISIRECEH